MNWLYKNKSWFRIGFVNLIIISTLLGIFYGSVVLIRQAHSLDSQINQLEFHKELIEKLPKLKEYESSLVKSVKDYQTHSKQLTLGQVTELINSKLSQHHCQLIKMEVGDNTLNKKVFRLKLECSALEFNKIQSSFETNKEIFSIQSLIIKKSKAGSISQDLNLTFYQGGLN